jgi:hypothetical protein
MSAAPSIFFANNPAVIAKKKEKMSMCEVCEIAPTVHVCCVPFVPYSAAYCEDCLVADAHPLFVLIGQTAILGGFDKAHENWQGMIAGSP